MTSEQVLHFSRLRLLLREQGTTVDLQRAREDSGYLNEILVIAMNSPSAALQESAYLLGASFGLADVKNEPVKPFSKQFAPEDLLPELTSDSEEAAWLEIEDDRPVEPAAISFQAERAAVLRKYTAGLR